MLISKVVVLLGLGYASWEDLKNWQVHDKVFIYTLVIALVFGAYQEGATFAGSMIVQGILGGVVGLFLNLAGKFGGADIWTLVVATMVFPDILLFVLLAYLLIPMVLWVKVYNLFSRFSEEEGAPAIPGLFIGYLILLSVYGI